MTNIYEAWLAHLHTCTVAAGSQYLCCSLVRSYFKPANGLSDTKKSLTGSLSSRAMALSRSISSASAASLPYFYTDGNHARIHEYRRLV